MSANLAHLYRFNSGLLALATKEFEDDDWTWRPDGGGNPAHWILGHITYCRHTILEKLGEEADSATLEPTYGRGTQPGQTFEPSPAALRKDFRATGERLARVLTDLPDDVANQDLGREMPDGSNTVGGYLQFMQIHETLHLGQLQYLGRCRGKAGIA